METLPMKLEATERSHQPARDESSQRLLESLLESNRIACRTERTLNKAQAAVGLVTSSPVGRLLVCVNDRGIAMIHFLRGEGDLEIAVGKVCREFEAVADQTAARRVAAELTRFMDGDETALHAPIDLRMVRGAFQRRVLERLVKVGPGAILTYSSLGAWTGAPDAPRAVGGAMHDNPIPVYVPCHRVVRSDLSLGGYGGGLDIKRNLLSIEGFSFTPSGSVDDTGAVWGNRHTRVFCRIGCRALAHADRANALLFRNAARARRSGMRACRICNP